MSVLDSFLVTSCPRVYRESPVWEKYSKVSALGKGTYGHVFEACNEYTGDRFAIKEIRMMKQRESIPLLPIREISCLQALALHPCIVRLEEVKVDQDCFYLVLEMLDCTLHQLLNGLDGRSLTGTVFNHVVFQLLSATAFMHSRRILSRDIKPTNVLVDISRGRVKLADYGLARFQSDVSVNGLLTVEVASLWYRPVEVLLGSANYGEGIDLWARGCIIAELYLGHPLFDGKDEQVVCNKIFTLLGSPSLTESAHWPHFETLPLRTSAKNVSRTEALDRLACNAPSFVDIYVHQTVINLLQLDHKLRPSARTLLTDSTWLKETVQQDFVLSVDFVCPGWDTILKRLEETRTLASLRVSSDDSESSEDL